MSYVKFVFYGKDDTYKRNFTRSITYENAHKSIEIEKRQIHINPLNRGSSKIKNEKDDIYVRTGDGHIASGFYVGLLHRVIQRKLQI